MGNKSNTEIKVLTFYDGDTEAIDAFADVIRYKIRQRIRERKKLKIANEIDVIVTKDDCVIIGLTSEKPYNNRLGGCESYFFDQKT